MKKKLKYKILNNEKRNKNPFKWCVIYLVYSSLIISKIKCKKYRNIWKEMNVKIVFFCYFVKFISRSLRFGNFKFVIVLRENQRIVCWLRWRIWFDWFSSSNRYLCRVSLKKSKSMEKNSLINIFPIIMIGGYFSFV